MNFHLGFSFDKGTLPPWRLVAAVKMGEVFAVITERKKEGRETSEGNRMKPTQRNCPGWQEPSWDWSKWENSS